MIFIASSIYVSNFLLPQLQRELQPNIPHNMKHHRTTKFSFAKQKFSCRHIFTQGRIEAHNKIFNSQQLPSQRILCHYKYLKHIALQFSLSLSNTDTHSFSSSYPYWVGLFPLWPSFSFLPSCPSISFFIHSLSDTLSLFFSPIILLIQTFCFWKPTYILSLSIPTKPSLARSIKNIVLDFSHTYVYSLPTNT